MMTYLRRKKKNITDRILRTDGRHFDLELILAQFPKVRFLIHRNMDRKELGNSLLLPETRSCQPSLFMNDKFCLGCRHYFRTIIGHSMD